jgi:hypothetical protein
MAQQESERRHDEPPEQLTEAEIAAEGAAELPDREAMSLVSPGGGLGARPEWIYMPGPLPQDGPMPAEPMPAKP